MVFQPPYLALFESGELLLRAKRMEQRLASCDICPRECGVNRLKDERGVCHSGRLPIVSSYCAHRGEEPALSGTRGSGTIFFGNCNMRCVYCQNFQISQNWKAQEQFTVDYHKLAGMMLALQEQGCHNINLVSPTHFVPQILSALVEAVPMGLRLPVVYNTSGYDSPEIIRELDDIVSVYLPDLRYANEDMSMKYSAAPGYVTAARQSIKEMYRQVGDLVVDEDGIAEKGVIVRHLILPNGIAGSEESLTWLVRAVSSSVTVSIMSQYYPIHRAGRFPLLSRRINCGEYIEAVRLLEKLGLENGWQQEMDAAENYLPDFTMKHPFERGADSL